MEVSLRRAGTDDPGCAPVVNPLEEASEGRVGAEGRRPGALAGLTSKWGGALDF